MSEDWCEGCSPENCSGCGGINKIYSKEKQMTTEQNIKTVMVIGGMIYGDMNEPQQAWIEMIEKVLVSQGYFPEWDEFSKLADDLNISQATPEELKTVWWDKYQVMVREIGGVLVGTER